MKAKEVLERYKSGRRNFQGVNLRGQSFEGEDLSGANFRKADLRGTNFKLANLQGVNFTEAKAGLQEQSVVFSLIISFFASILSGFCSIIITILVVYLIAKIQSSDSSYSDTFVLAGLFYLPTIIGILIFLSVTFGKGLVEGARVGVKSFAAVFAVYGAVVGAGAGGYFFAETVFGAVTVAFAFAGAVVGAVVGAGAGVITGAVAVAFAFAGVVAGAITGAVAGVEAVTFTVAIAFTAAVIGAAILFFSLNNELGFGAGAFALLGFYFYIGWRALKTDERDAWIRGFAVAFAATGGTSFQGANLTNADFTNAILKNSDFRESILTGTCFHQAKKLDLARLGKTNLKNLNVEESEDFLTPLRRTTLDLYHSQPIDPRLAAISFQDLQKANPKDELELISVAATGKNQDKLHLTASASPEADKSALHDEYFTNIDYLKSLSPEAKEALLIERGATVKKLLEVSPTINNDHSLTTNISGTVNASGTGAFNLGHISGTVADTINQLPPSSNPNEPGIKDLLTQLQQAIDDPNLSDDDKQQTLEQLQVLATASKDPHAEIMQKKARKAVGFLKVIAEEIEPTTKLAQTCASVLPKIHLFFGL